MSKNNQPVQFAGGTIKIVGTLPAPGTPGAAQPYLPFAQIEYPTVATFDGTFQSALENAMSVQVAAGRFGAGSRIAFSIIALATPSGTHRYAGKLDDEMHFSASLVKVAALFAAHELLAAARRLAEKKGFADAVAFRAALVSTFDAVIQATAVPTVRNLVVNAALMGRAPNYDAIFEITNTGVANVPNVEFTATFQDDLLSMIGHGTNTGASRVIRKLSYAYINAALIKGGFFTPAHGGAADNGIWLAGDYLGDKNRPPTPETTQPIPYVRINCLNDCAGSGASRDCTVAQISTTRRMANLFALIALGRMPSGDTKMVTDPADPSLGTVPDGNRNMRQLLSEPKPLIPGTNRADLAWVAQSRLVGVTARFTVTHDKIGVAPLKSGRDVHSEGLIVRWIPQGNDTADLARRNLSGKLAISWQNLVGPPPAQFDGIARVINDAFAAYIASPV
jgi:hypothetical protein